MNKSNIVRKKRSFSGLEVESVSGSRRKQTLSNHISITVTGDRSDVEIRLTPRQARALKGFLNETL